MSRLRFIVDRPRGPRGGNNDSRSLYKDLSAAKLGVEERPAREWAGQIIRAAKPAGRILVVDLDAILPFDATPDEHVQWHESQMLHHNAELMRLRECVDVPEAKYLTSTDLALIREAVSEWYLEEDRLRRRGGATPAAAGAFFLLRDLWREGKFGGR